MTASASMDTQPDLSSCEREPIRIPGAIQPHGVLLAMHPADLRVVQVSGNYGDIFGAVDIHAGGRPFETWANDEHRDMLEAALMGHPISDNPLHFRGLGGQPLILGTVSYSGDLVVLELERDSDKPITGGLMRMRRAASRLEHVKNLDALYEAIVEEMQALCDYDRVMLYRFDEDWHGEVVAERVKPSVESYLGLHYPASDIPSQARELYRTNWLRYIPDIGYTPTPLLRVDEGVDAVPLDLSTAYLRSVSPIHIEYMRNMGVGATLTVSLLQNGKLWGLISLHNMIPKHVQYEVRSAAEFFGRIVSLQLATLDEKESLVYQLQNEKIYDSLAAKFESDRADLTALARQPDEFLDLVHADSAAIINGDVVKVIGGAPIAEYIGEIAEWICKNSPDDLYVTNSLALLNTRFEQCLEASGVIAIIFSRKPLRMVMWYRAEFQRSISWGGDPNKPVVWNEDKAVISPRTSFTRWSKIQRFRSRAWTSGEVSAARELRSRVSRIFTLHASELDRTNIQLARSNRELDDFAHIASHDLKEPLRGIHNYASYLIEDYGDVLDEDGRDKLNTLVRLTQRMDILIESLLQFSRFGRVDFEESVSDLDSTIADVVDLYGPRIEARKARLEIAENFPTIRGDQQRISEVFNNIISNALKYSDQEAPHIRIGFLPPSASDSRVTIFVEDDGIGIPARHLRTVFQMFKRLHPVDGYGGGTGAGLAIALRIIERHNGKMWLESEAGKGTTVFFTLEIVR